MQDSNSAKKPKFIGDDFAYAENNKKRNSKSFLRKMGSNERQLELRRKYKASIEGMKGNPLDYLNFEDIDEAEMSSEIRDSKDNADIPTESGACSDACCDSVASLLSSLRAKAKTQQYMDISQVDADPTETKSEKISFNSKNSK